MRRRALKRFPLLLAIQELARLNGLTWMDLPRGKPPADHESLFHFNPAYFVTAVSAGQVAPSSRHNIVSDNYSSQAIAACFTFFGVTNTGFRRRSERHDVDNW